MTPLLLFTSSINHTDLLGSLNDSVARIKHTIESITEWVKIDSQIQMLICGGSGWHSPNIVDTSHNAI